MKIGDRVIQRGGDPDDVGVVVHINEHGLIVELPCGFEVSVRPEDVEPAPTGCNHMTEDEEGMTRVELIVLIGMIALMTTYFVVAYHFMRGAR